ncbi:MAG: hypothetical protein WC248_01060 [Candidatus Methanomethylophilaceae archaeon]|jgi:predicted transcriptional regulator
MHINYSRSELHLLSEYSRGTDGVEGLSVKLKVSVTQIYRIIESLRKKNVIILKNGKIVNENRTHIVLLLNILRDSEDAYIPLSDRGMEIMMVMKEPVTMKEIAYATRLNVSTVSRKIKQMFGRSMVIRDGMKYSLNNKVWNELSELCSETEKYENNIDFRVPNGCELYHSDERSAVFSSASDLPFTRTAFSVFEKFGIKVCLGTNYYTTENADIAVDEVFLHSLWVIFKDKDWKLKMMSMIFYVKNKEYLQNIRHPIKNEMDAIISGKEVKGWVSVEEMQGRAEMYGVTIIDKEC